MNIRRAKIIATVGPACQERLDALIQAGADMLRLNFSHGDHNNHAEVIARVRALEQEAGRPIGILQDLQGPKLRTGRLKGDKPVMLEAGQRLILTTEAVEGTKTRIGINYPPLPEEVRPGDRILLDDGQLELRVLEVHTPEIHTEVVIGGQLGSRKGLNLPGVQLSAPSLTEKDRRDLAFGISQGVDAVALSFVRRGEDVHRLRDAIHANLNGARPPLVIAKLERPEAIENLVDILELSDGVMVARGDLGVEVSPEKVPSIQKQIIRMACAHQRFAITATQMLESMINSPRPTRAEASDVANAVFDGSDALMLSGETAMGTYPIAAVRTMERIILDAEAHMPEWGRGEDQRPATTDDDAIATTHAARALAHDRNVAAIAVFTRSGRTARLMSFTRPRVPILAFSPEERTYRQLSLAWGVVPYLIPTAQSVEEMIEHVRRACLASGLVRSGQQVVMIASLPVGAMGPPNFTLLQTI